MSKCNFIEITLPHGCSHVNLLHIFRTPFYRNTSGGLFLSKQPQPGGGNFCSFFSITGSGKNTLELSNKGDKTKSFKGS